MTHEDAVIRIPRQGTHQSTGHRRICQGRSTSETSDEPLRVLVIDDERFHAEAVAESLERVGYACVVATSGTAGARKIEHEDFDVILTDLRMSDMDGLAILRKAKQAQPDAEVVVITGHGDVKTAVEAIKQGAANYLTKPVDMAELRAIVDRAAERLRLARTNRELKRQLDEKFGFEGVVGNSAKMQDLLAKLRTVAPTNASVLIQGETGTGKELVARAIHYNSPRQNKPFVALNCTALNENLLDDELFGHEAGVYTGAERLRKGRFEYANGGTLFLDEIGDMPLALQAKLLRVLENGEVVRIGSNEPMRVNVRVLSATHRDLEAAVAEGDFRQDLYFRLKVVMVRLPSLRERREDLPLLAATFIKESCARHGKQVPGGLSEVVRRAMAAYDWPGNVRELQEPDRKHGRAGHRRRTRHGRHSRRGISASAAVSGQSGGQSEQPGRPALDGGRALLHRAGPGVDQGQPRGSGPVAGHW